METEVIVRARIDRAVKERAAAALGEMGLTLSEAIRLLLVRVAAERALPFDVKVPNAATRAAMAETDLPSFDSTEALFADLNAPD